MPTVCAIFGGNLLSGSPVSGLMNGPGRSLPRLMGIDGPSWEFLSNTRKLIGLLILRVSEGSWPRWTHTFAISR